MTSGGPADKRVPGGKVVILCSERIWLNSSPNSLSSYHTSRRATMRPRSRSTAIRIPDAQSQHGCQQGCSLGTFLHGLIDFLESGSLDDLPGCQADLSNSDRNIEPVPRHRGRGRSTYTTIAEPVLVQSTSTGSSIVLPDDALVSLGWPQRVFSLECRASCVSSVPVSLFAYSNVGAPTSALD